MDRQVRRSYDDTQAPRFLQETIACFGVSGSELASLKRNDSRKLAIARLIRERTRVPNQWIAREFAAPNLCEYACVAIIPATMCVLEHHVELVLGHSISCFVARSLFRMTFFAFIYPAAKRAFSTDAMNCKQ